LARLESGAALALVSDAGTPLVSDPGFKLVSEALAQGAPVTAVPGASAVLAALVVAGLPTDRFFFEGFLPQKQGARRTRIAELSAIPGTLVFFESPRRLAGMLADLAAVLGARQAAIARELTKHFETVRRGSLPELAAALASEEPPKGEIVVLVAPPAENEDAGLDDAAIDAKLHEALRTLSVKDAASVVAAESGQKRRKIYARAITLAAASDKTPDE
jgi:16S rRNA (cytidine1402-2'-O)-methyltransferase